MPKVKRIGKKIWRAIKYSLLYVMIRGLIFIAHIPPRRRWLSFTGWLGMVYYTFSNKTRKLVSTHLSMAFKEKSPSEIKKLSREVFRMLGKNAGDVLLSTTIKSAAEMDKIMVVHGQEHFEQAKAKGKGIVFISCHIGAFDIQVTNMALRGLNPHVVGTPLKDKRLNDLLWRHRNQYGAVAVARGKETFRMLKVLKSGGSVALLIDQDTRVKNVFVDFFGMPAATPVGATLLAMKTNATVVPSYIHLGEDGMQHMHFLPEVPMRITDDEEADVQYNTQVLTTCIENLIRQHPAQWVWMHRRWKTKPSEEEKPVEATKN